MGFAEEEHSDQRGAGGADASPHRVASADRDRFKRMGEQEEAGDHQRDGANAGPEARKALRVFEADGPCDFEQAGDDEVDPCHGGYGAAKWEDVECGRVYPMKLRPREFESGGKPRALRLLTSAATK